MLSTPELVLSLDCKGSVSDHVKIHLRHGKKTMKLWNFKYIGFGIVFKDKVLMDPFTRSSHLLERICKSHRDLQQMNSN